MREFKVLAVGAVLAFTAVAAMADSAIVGYTFDLSTKAPAYIAPNVTASIFDSADGTTIFAIGNPSSGQAIADLGWKGQGNYYLFTVTPDADFTLALSSLTFDDYRTATGPTNWEVLYRVGGSGEFTTAGFGSVHASFAATPMNTLSLSGIGALQSVTEATTFRIIATGASNDTNKYWYLDNVTLSGVVVPEPATLSLLGLGAVVMLRKRRGGRS